MQFSLDQFYRLNRRVLIWAALFGLIWLLRDFFGLVFLTFVLAFIAAPMIRFCKQRVGIPRRAAILLVFGVFLLTLVAVGAYVIPRVVREAFVLAGNVSNLEQRLMELKDELVRDYPALKDVLPGYIESALSEAAGITGHDFKKEYDQKLLLIRQNLGLAELDLFTRDEVPSSDTLKLEALQNYDSRREELLVKTLVAQQATVIGERLPEIARMLRSAVTTTLLALLFSFLISMDLARLGREVKSLSDSRLHDFYEQTAQPVVRFAYVVGRAIQAQAMIACVNTLLTLIGMILLDLPSLAMLAVIVFGCSFIPVLGVFISTTPIVLVALNSQGIGVALLVILMVCLVHAVEAYVLNPLIYGKHLNINPVLVLMILFIGHHAFGLWGMVLGVPVAHYIIHDVIGLPLWDESKLKPREDRSADAGPVALEEPPAPDEAPTEKEAKQTARI